MSKDENYWRQKRVRERNKMIMFDDDGNVEMCIIGITEHQSN